MEDYKRSAALMDKKAINTVKSILDLYSAISNDLWAIQDLVQNNQKFFHAKAGESTLKSVRETLERIITNQKIYLDKNPYME